MKKLISILLSFTIMLSIIPTAIAQTNDLKNDSIIYLDFENKLPDNVKSEGDFAYTEGVEGNAGLFNGENTYLVLPENITESITDFTISAWVRFDNITPNVWQRVFDFGNDNESNLFLGTWQWQGSNNVRGSVNGNGQPTSFGVYELGEWIHYALTQADGRLNLYINGRLMASTDAESNLKDFVSTNNYLGYYNKNTEPTAHFNGAMDEFFFAPFALDAVQINDIAFSHLSDEDKVESLLSRVYLTKNEDNTFSYFTYDDSHSFVKWTSSNPDILTVEDGLKAPDPTLCDVTLTATVTSGGISKAIDYNYVAGDFSGSITFMETTLEKLAIDEIRKKGKEIDTDKTYLITRKSDGSYLSQNNGNLSFTKDKIDTSALWRFHKAPKENNTYSISNLSSGKCLNVKNYNTEKGAEVILYQGGKGINELWYIAENGGKTGILSYMAEWFFCDDFTLKGLEDFTDWEIIETENTLLTYGTAFTPSQSKYAQFDTDYYYALKCEEGYITSDLTKTVKKPTNISAQWALTNIEGEYYTITNRLTGKNLNISGASTAVNANVILYSPGTAANEQFSFEETSFGMVITGRNNKHLLTFDNSLSMTRRVTFWRAEKLSERPVESSPFNADMYLSDYIPSVTEETDSDTGFIHPGILITKDNIVRMQTKIREGAEPWASSFEKLAAADISSPTVRIYAYDSNADTTALKSEARLKNMRMDSRSVVNQALMYVITGDEVYRENTMTILRMWSKLRDVYTTLGSDRIDHGEIGFKMAFAAELMKYTSCENPDLYWTEYDNEQFCMMLETIQPKHDSWWYWMNQHGICNLATIANAIFLNDMELYKLAVQRTTTNPENGGSIDYTQGSGGAITQVFRIVDFDAWNNDSTEPTFVHAEMGRDQGHAYGCLGSLSLCAQMLHTQKTKVDPVTGAYSEEENAVNIFQFADERLLQAASYMGKYNLGYDVMHPTIDVGSHYSDINDTNRGAIYPAFGILYNYYKYEEGVDMDSEKYRYLKEAHEYNLPEGSINDFYIGFSDMLFAPESASVDLSLYEREGESSTTWQIENFTAVNFGIAEKMDGYAKITLDEKTQLAVTNGNYPPSVRNKVVLRVRTTSEVEVILQNEHTVNAPFVMGIIPNTKGEWMDISFTTLPEGVFGQRVFFLTFKGEGEIDVDYMKFTE